ncbi:DUF397 domain-containing protein [Lentzea tibetensis]|uniref:DUF397 domain-containing protein n=1 Tax=Lentzea tibetensis TaxID=2591470 RepID=A0A563ENM4_9PSEU|nr:DUF397 domain-containing protein [Lentzea tibetensis]TWP48840.1 DUF397 domain-containing protein [Lentzea tibetensis]
MTPEHTWRKSSYSDGTPEGSCVEVAFAEAVRIRDSKHATGPQLTFSANAWRAFTSRTAPRAD